MLTGLGAACGLARIVAGAVPTMVGGIRAWQGQAKIQLSRGTGGVQGLDGPNSPEMGPAEGTLIPPLTHQPEPSEGE